MRVRPAQSHSSEAALRGLMLLALRTRRGQPGYSAPSQQGLTLIECLVAIVIITLTVVAITPPIMMATATRIQARRAEQANQIAQAEIDRVRAIVERGGSSYDDQAVNLLPQDAGTNSIKDIGVASSSLSGSPLLSPGNCTGVTKYPDSGPVAANQLVLVDVDGKADTSGKCTPEYAMQVFRTTGYKPLGSSSPYSFVVGVRVYTVYPGETTLPSLDKDRASLVSGTGPKDTVNVGGTVKRRPLAVLYTQVARNDSSKSLCQLRLISNPNDPCQAAPTPSPSPSSSP